MTEPLISVVIPCRNEVGSIEACLSALWASDWPNFEILVIDGMSDDGTRELLKLQAQDPRLRVCDNPARFTPVAFNIGIQAARGDLIQIVGARQILSADYLRCCYKVLMSDEKIACVGGQARHAFNSRTSEIIAQAITSPFGVGTSNFRVLSREADVDTVGTPLYRRSVLEAVGGFDEALVRNQDDELNYRLRQAGYRIVFTPTTSLDYFVRASYAQLWRQYFQYGYWKTYVNRKHGALTTLRQVIPALFVLFLFGGALLALIWPLLLLIYLPILFLYLSLGIWTACSRGLGRFSLQMIQAMLVLHLAYGLGYLEGLLHFFVLRRQPKAQHTRLSR
jgi:GT2 family glycosyltransferase